MENRCKVGYGKSVGFIPPKESISQNLPLLKLSNFERGNLYDLLTLLHCFSPLDGSDTQKTRSQRTLVGKIKPHSVDY